MNLQRLKFAWARGAHIQVQIKPEFDRGSKWSGDADTTPPASMKEYHEGRYNYRIRPKDAYLEYGPLSSALIAISAGRAEYLKLAESLADEGL